MTGIRICARAPRVKPAKDEREADDHEHPQDVPPAEQHEQEGQHHGEARNHRGEVSPLAHRVEGGPGGIYVRAVHEAPLEQGNDVREGKNGHGKGHPARPAAAHGGEPGHEEEKEWSHEGKAARGSVQERIGLPQVKPQGETQKQGRACPSRLQQREHGEGEVHRLADARSPDDDQQRRRDHEGECESHEIHDEKKGHQPCRPLSMFGGREGNMYDQGASGAPMRLPRREMIEMAMIAVREKEPAA